MSVFDFLLNRKKAYQQAFLSPAGQQVLRDLAIFCRANESAAIPGSNDKTFMLVGRREVWLRIQQHLNLNSDELAALYTGKSLKAEGGDT